MEELNKIFKGFEVLTTPYDKVDSRIITKKNAITLLNQIGGTGEGKEGEDTTASNNTKTENEEGGNGEGEEGGTGEGEEGGTGEGGNNSTGNPEKGKSNNSGEKKPGFLEKARLAAAEEAEEDKGTTIPDGKEMMKKVIKVGAIIMYIMLLPLMPWYYVMKYSFAKLNVLYKGVVRPL